MPHLQTYRVRFRDTGMRYVLVDQAPWFAAHDVGLALDINHSTGTLRRRVADLPADDRSQLPIATEAGSRTMAAISLSGMLKLSKLRNRQVDREMRSWIDEAVPGAVEQAVAQSNAIQASNVIGLKAWSARRRFLCVDIINTHPGNCLSATPAELLDYINDEVAALLCGDWDSNASLAPFLRSLADQAEKQFIEAKHGGAFLEA